MPASRRIPPDSDVAWRRPLKRLLRETFGLQRLREGQEAVIASVMGHAPTLAIMPTGAGKSLCYQLPALLLPGITLVVSPLIALMKDQCDKLRERGVDAHQLNSAVGADELAAAQAEIATGSARIVFVTPERLADPAFLSLLGDRPIALLVIDEAHCVSQWGHDFRPAFLEIGRVLKQLGRPRVLALTATAGDAVVEDLARQLGVGRFSIVNTGLYRPNLRFQVVAVTNEAEKLARAVEIVAGSAGAGLVYTSTVEAAQAVHAALLEAGVEAGLYHGRVGATQRREQQDAFMSGRVRVMVATNAFGLGIDKADTRFVLHYQMPSGLDAYYQEAGRAGRDGDPAECTLLFMHADKAVQQFFLAGRYPSQDDLAALYRALSKPREDGRPWTLESLHEALARPETKLQVAIGLLRHQRVLRQAKDGSVSLARASLDERALGDLLAGYQVKREADRAMLERMVFYGQTGHCRWKVVLGHFNEDERFIACDHCDNCFRRSRAAEAQSPTGEETVAAAPVPAKARPPFGEGEVVRVARYGRGHVEAVSAEGVTVRFESGDRRVFLPEFVRPAAGPRRAPPPGARVELGLMA